MPGGRSFRIVYDRDIPAHLAAIDSKHYPLIRKTIEEELAAQPDVETRNRTPLGRPSAFGTAWELRLGPADRFRVCHAIDLTAAQVSVLAIGEKRGSTLRS